MKILKKHVLYFILAGILFELFFGLGLLVTDSQEIVRAADMHMMQVFVDVRSNDMNAIMRWVTDLGGYEFVLHMTVIVGLLMAVFGHIEVSLGIISSIALTNYVTGIMKRFFHIYRPDEFLVRAGGWSYPSGHVSGSAILAIMVIWAACVAIPKKYKLYRILAMIVVPLYAISVAISRMYLGVHWLSDVIGGMLLAGVVAAVMMGILKPVIMKRCSIVK